MAEYWAGTVLIGSKEVTNSKNRFVDNTVNMEFEIGSKKVEGMESRVINSINMEHRIPGDDLKGDMYGIQEEWWWWQQVEDERRW